MKQKKSLAVFTAAMLSASLTFGQVYFEDCNPRGGVSSCIGISNISAGAAAFSSGIESQAIGDYSTAFGREAVAGGLNSFAWGEASSASGSHSLAFGKYVQSSGVNSFVLGTGESGSTPLVNSIDNSLMIGFGSDPILFVAAKSGGPTAIGRVGIGKTNPSYSLDVVGAINTSSNYKINGANLSASHIGAEPAFSKNTAFNKNFGTASGTVAQGNHNHTGIYEPANANIQPHISDATIHFTQSQIQINASQITGLDYYNSVDFNADFATKSTADLPTGGNNLYSQWSNVTGGINYAGGNVGIGTTDPQGKLHIDGGYLYFDDYNNNILFDAGQVRITNHDGYGNWQIKQGADDNDNYVGAKNGAIKFRMDENGKLQIYSAPAGTGPITWNTGIVQDALGNIGVGKINPQSKLDVTGDINISGNYKINGINLSASGIGAEPAFSKNTAFNKNFGTTSGTVAQGNHNHTGIYEPANANIQPHISDATIHFTQSQIQINASQITGLNYYNSVDFNADFATKSTADLPTGGNNLYSQWSDVTGGINYAGGNVGIGTTEPSAKLELANIASSGAEDALKIGVNGEYDASIKFYDEQGEYSQHFKITFGAGTQDLKFHSDEVDNILYLTQDGNVGIGMTNPSEKLELSDGGIQLNTAYGIGFRGEIPYNADVTKDGGKVYYDEHFIGTNRDWMVIEKTDNNANNPDGGIAFTNKGMDNIREVSLAITGDGNVGIGTANPQSELAVDGKIMAKDLAVDGKITAKDVEVTLTGWPDYVFEENYTLNPLCELENYIKTHKHLPDVPSETEVKENGVNLGEMDAILLQKIEELTLYVVEQQKEIEALKEKVNKTIK